uniref:HTH OST-type domain-containing protein n=1 Tax=Panagrellus redivivus TaxID=6233 RepID=A0A7E4VG85_PANRE
MSQGQSSNFNNNNNSNYASCRQMPLNSDSIAYNTNNNKAAYGYHPTTSRASSQFQNPQNSAGNTQQRNNYYPTASSSGNSNFPAGQGNGFASGSGGNRVLATTLSRAGPSTSSSGSYQQGQGSGSGYQGGQGSSYQPSNVDFQPGPSGSKEFQSVPSSSSSYQPIPDRIGFHSGPSGSASLQPGPSTSNYQPGPSGSALPSIPSNSVPNNGSFQPPQNSNQFPSGPSTSNTFPPASNNNPALSSMTLKKMYMNRQTGRPIDTNTMNRHLLQQYIIKKGFPIDTRYSDLKRAPSHLFTRHYLGTRTALNTSEFDKYLPKPACKAIHPHADLFLNLAVAKNYPGEELGELVFDQETLAGIARVQSLLLVGCPSFLKPNVVPEPVPLPPAPTPIPTPPVISPAKRKSSQFQAKVEEIPLDQCHGLNARQHLLLVQQQNQRPAHVLNREQNGPLFVPQQTRSFQVPTAPAVRAADEVGSNLPSNGHPSAQRSQSFATSQPSIEAIDAYVYDGTMPVQFRQANGYAETAPTVSTMQYTQVPAPQQSQSQPSVFWPSPSPSSSSSSAASTSAQTLTSPPLLSPVRGQTRSSRPIPPNMVVFDQNRPTTLRGLPNTNRSNPSAPTNPGATNGRSNMGGNAGRNLSPAKAAPAPASLRRKERTIVSTAKAIVSYYPIDENPNPIKRRRTGSPFSELNPSTVGMVP